jgi:hypothetical protein
MLDLSVHGPFTDPSNPLACSKDGTSRPLKKSVSAFSRRLDGSTYGQGNACSEQALDGQDKIRLRFTSRYQQLTISPARTEMWRRLFVTPCALPDAFLTSLPAIVKGPVASKSPALPHLQNSLATTC